MLEQASRKAILKHQKKNVSANLLWGPSLPDHLVKVIEDGCEDLRKLGYFANPFPEGDGIVLSHPAYAPQNALSDLRSIFPWLHIEDGKSSVAALYGSEVIRCKVLVPVEQLCLTIEIDAHPYRFIPAIGDSESKTTHPWHESLSTRSVENIRQMRESFSRSNSLGISQDTLLAYPLVEFSLSIPYSELCTANEYPDGMIPLLRRCAECADRGIDLLRLAHCDYSRHEHIPGTAGQLQSGLHAAYVIPLERSPFKPKLYCHFAAPFQVMPNWLGLEVNSHLSLEKCDLAPLLFAPGSSEISQRVRGAARAVGQALYMLTPEARFTSLVFALDGLCAPKREWSGLTHHAYIAAIIAEGNASQFEIRLRSFDKAYKSIRNPIVHRGSSFIELDIDPTTASSNLMELANLCISSIVGLNIETVESLRAYAVKNLRTPAFQDVLVDLVDSMKEAQPTNKSIRMPQW